MPMSPQAAWLAPLTATESSAGDMLALEVAACGCRHPSRRHVTRVACAIVPPPPGGIFCQIFSYVVLFDISVGQLVSFVKNSRLAQTFGMTAEYARLKGKTDHNMLPDVT
jgi:hypothetical protein